MTSTSRSGRALRAPHVAVPALRHAFAFRARVWPGHLRSGTRFLNDPRLVPEG